MAVQPITASSMLCKQCEELTPFNNKDGLQRVSKGYKRVDQYPNLSTLTASAASGCGICKLLKDAMLHAYSDKEIAKEESLYDASIQSTWPTTIWNGTVEIYGPRFGIEKTSESSDDIEEEDEPDTRPPSVVQDLSFNLWPYPPKRQQEDAFRNDSKRIYFNVYTASSQWHSLRLVHPTRLI